MKLGGLTNMVMDEEGNIRPAQKATPKTEGYTSTFLPIRKDEQGYHPATPGILSAFLDSAQDPGRAMRGEYVTPEKALEFGMNVGGGGIALNAGKPIVAGELSTFGGRKTLQNLINAGFRPAEKLNRFEQLQADLAMGKNFTPEEMDAIWLADKLDVGFADRMVRHEISPDTKIRREALGSRGVRLDKAVNNPEFMAALGMEAKRYGISDVPASESSYLGFVREPSPPPKKRPYGGEIPKTPIATGRVALSKTLTDEDLGRFGEHELSHLVDFFEGHAQGGNTGAVQAGKLLRKRVLLDEDIKRYETAAEDQIAKVLKKYGVSTDRENGPLFMGGGYIMRKLDEGSIYGVPEELKGAVAEDLRKLPAYRLRGEYERGRKLRKELQSRVHKAYEDLAGESSSRLAEVRHFMTPEERAARRPSKSFDAGEVAILPNKSKIDLPARTQQHVFQGEINREQVLPHILGKAARPSSPSPIREAINRELSASEPRWTPREKKKQEALRIVREAAKPLHEAKAAESEVRLAEALRNRLAELKAKREEWDAFLQRHQASKIKKK